jgi:hypothetical protein
MERLRTLPFGSHLLYLLLVIGITACTPAPDSNENINQPIEPAQANAGPMQNTYVSNAAILDGSSSSGTGIIYHWAFRSKPASSQARIAGFETARPYFFPDTVGTYVLQLTVMDAANGTSKDFVSVNVVDSPLNITGTVSASHEGVIFNCIDCHNGDTATGKSAAHIDSTNECIVCHSTEQWLPNIVIDHNEILGSCSYCHNGSRAPGKPADHIQTTEECVVCHTAGTTFSIVFVSDMLFNTLDENVSQILSSDHPPIGDAMCVDCHNNVVEEGKPDDHIPASDSCDNCHTTDDWDIANSAPDGSSDHPPINGMMCVDCHNNVIEEGKPADHIPASDTCENCHVITDWEITAAGSGPSNSDHPPTNGLMCIDCHNNVVEEGKPADHIPASDSCDNCHTMDDWDINGSGSYDDGHPPIGDAMCVDCHNNVIQEGKPDDHIPASDTCENCHITSDWEDVAGGSSTSGSSDEDDEEESEDHPPIGNLMCVDCHNNVVEEGKEDDHILTTNVCEACHTTNDWERILTVDHVEVLGDCSSCHNNDIAQGKPAGHVITTQECNACHSTTAW